MIKRKCPCELLSERYTLNKTSEVHTQSWRCNCETKCLEVSYTLFQPIHTLQEHGREGCHFIGCLAQMNNLWPESQTAPLSVAPWCLTCWLSVCVCVCLCVCVCVCAPAGLHAWGYCLARRAST